MTKLSVLCSLLTVVSMLGCAADSSMKTSQIAGTSKNATSANCPSVSGFEDVISHLNSMIDGYNRQDDAPFHQYLDDNVVMTVFEIGGRVRQTAGKDQYLSDLSQSWKNTNPQWTRVCIWQPIKLSNLVKVPVTYDFGITPQSQARRMVPSMAVLYFTNAEGKLIDANYSTRSLQP